MEEENNKTPFNMGVATLERMNLLLNNASQSASCGDYYTWYSLMSVLRRDVFPFLTEEEILEIEKGFNEMPIGAWIKSTKTGKLVPRNIDLNNEIYFCLDKIDIKMRTVMKKKGLLMPKMEQ